MKKTVLLLTMSNLILALSPTCFADEEFGEKQMKVLKGMFSRIDAMCAANIVMRPDVQRELDLSETQIDAMKTIRKSNSTHHLMQKLNVDFASMQGKSGRQLGREVSKYQSRADELYAKTCELLQNELSKRQSDRLDELEFRHALFSGNADGALKAAEIDLSNEDKAELRKRIHEANVEVSVKTAILHQHAYLEAFASVLGEKELEKIAGTDFYFAPITIAKRSDVVEKMSQYSQPESIEHSRTASAKKTVGNPRRSR